MKISRKTAILTAMRLLWRSIFHREIDAYIWSDSTAMQWDHYVVMSLMSQAYYQLLHGHLTGNTAQSNKASELMIEAERGLSKLGILSTPEDHEENK